MAKIYKNAAELVGNTPLLEVGNLEKRAWAGSENTCEA